MLTDVNTFNNDGDMLYENLCSLRKHRREKFNLLERTVPEGRGCKCAAAEITTAAVRAHSGAVKLRRTTARAERTRERGERERERERGAKK